MIRIMSFSRSMKTTYSRFQCLSKPITASRASSLRLASTTTSNGSKKLILAYDCIFLFLCLHQRPQAMDRRRLLRLLKRNTVMVDRVDPGFFVIPDKSDAIENEIYIHACSVGRTYLHCQYALCCRWIDAIAFSTQQKRFKYRLTDKEKQPN